MEQIFSSLNIEQLTTAGGFIAYLLWRIWTLEKVIERREADVGKWQDKFISILVESQKEEAQRTATYERVLNQLQSRS